jgi:hypothetical protein
VAGLGIQPVTVTVSSLVEDMLDSYHQVTAGLNAFSWSFDLAGLVEEFVLCQDVWHHSPNRQPTLEVTFSILNYGIEELDVEIAFTPSLPTVQFKNLRNTITEGEVFVVQPNIPIRASRARCAIETEYFLGPGHGWLSWDDNTASFRGAVPAKMASLIGAERFDAYTLPLELTTRLTRRFGNMRFERIFRCVLPLTVKRRAARCTNCSCASPFPSPEKLNARPSLIRLPLTRLPVKLGKENDALSMEKVHKPLGRKAEAGRTASPLRLNSLSLARLHDALALAHPPESVTDVEVRTVEYRRDSIYSDQENRPAPINEPTKEPTKEPSVGIEPHTPRPEPTRRCDSKLSSQVVDESNRKSSTPQSVCYKCAVLGLNHEEGGKDSNGRCTRCAGTPFLLIDDAIQQGLLSRRRLGCLATWNSGDANEEIGLKYQPRPPRPRVPTFQAPLTQNLEQFLEGSDPGVRKLERPPDADAAASHLTEAEPSQVDIDRWQASILRNYKEFERKATAIFDSAIEDDADEENTDGDGLEDGQSNA